MSVPEAKVSRLMERLESTGHRAAIVGTCEELRSNATAGQVHILGSITPVAAPAD